MTPDTKAIRALIEHMTRWALGEDPIAHFEQEAEAFYLATGLLAPGKSEPMDMGGDAERDNERRQAWARWTTARHKEKNEGVLALLDEMDEARATLENERGEGEPPGGRWFWTHNAWNARGPVGGLVTRDNPTWDADQQRWLPNTWTLSMRGRTDTTHPTARAAMRAATEATKVTG